MRHHRALLVALLVALALARAAGARDCSLSGNLVPNCGFEIDTGGWTPVADSFTRIASGCASGAGCAALDRLGPLGQAWSSCFPVTAGSYYAFGVSLRVASGAVPAGCYVELIEFSDAVCGADISGPPFLRVPSAAWREWIAGRTAAGQSAWIKLSCSSPTDFVIDVDDFFVVPAVFVDGFESNGMGKWAVV
jgi:hypothetical protein